MTKSKKSKRRTDGDCLRARASTDKLAKRAHVSVVEFLGKLDETMCLLPPLDKKKFCQVYFDQMDGLYDTFVAALRDSFDYWMVEFFRTAKKRNQAKKKGAKNGE